MWVLFRPADVVELGGDKGVGDLRGSGGVPETKAAAGEAVPVAEGTCSSSLAVV
jgi:hypothetical protein